MLMSRGRAAVLAVAVILVALHVVDAADPLSHPSLFSYWDFEPASIVGGTVVKDRLNGLNATIKGGLQFAPSRSGKGQAALFNGLDSYLSSRMNVAPTALTVMFWFRPIQSGGVILGQPGVWGDWAVMMTNTKRLFFFFYDPNRVDSKNGQLSINLLDTWLHYAAVYDGVSTCMQYLNGQLVKNNTCLPGGIHGSGGVLTMGQIGSIENTTYPWYNGYLDEVMIFTSALSNSDIISYGGAMGCGDGYCAWGYERPSTCPQDCIPSGRHPNLVGYWSFDSNQRNSTHVFDQAGAVRSDGKISGGLTFPAGRVGDAARFNGIDTAIEVFNPAALYDGMNQLTVAFFIKIVNVSLLECPNKMQVAAVPDAWGSWFTSVYCGRAYFNFYNTTRGVASPKNVPLLSNEWLHYAFVYDNTTCKSYIDGRLMRSDDCTLTTGGIQNSVNTRLVLGNRSVPVEGYNNFDGFLDEFMVFDTALDAKAINSLFPMGCGDGICLTGFENSFNCLDDCFDYGTVAQNADMTLWWADTMMKVFPQFIAPTRAASEPVTVRLAKREARFIQIAITPKTSKSGVAVAATSASDLSIALFEVRTMNIVRSSVNLRTAFAPLGDIPDPLIRTSSVDLVSGKSTSIMVEVTSTNVTSAGEYSLTLTIGSLSVPIKVVIYDFLMPLQLTLRNTVGIDYVTTTYSNATCQGRAICEYHGVAKSDTTNVAVLQDTYFTDMASNRISPGNPGDGWYLTNYYNCATQTLDTNKFDAGMRKYVDQLGMSAVGIFGPNKLRVGEWPLCGYDLNTNWTAWSDAMSVFLSKVGQHLVDNGWMDEAYILVNEPSQDSMWNNMQKVANMIKTRVSPAIIFGPAGGALNDVDMCPDCTFRMFINDDGSHHRTLIARPNVKATDKIWWYYIRTPHMNLDAEGADHVAWGWKAFPFNIQGLLTWGGSMFDMHCGSGFDPQPLELWKSIESEWGNGAVTFYYPPCGTQNCASANYTLVPTIRVKLWREGFQDHEYMTILKRLIAQKQGGVDVTAAQTALNRVSEIIYGAGEWATNAKLMRQIREQIAYEIVRLQGGVLPPSSSNPSTTPTSPTSSPSASSTVSPTPTSSTPSSASSPMSSPYTTSPNTATPTSSPSPATTPTTPTIGITPTPTSPSPSPTYPPIPGNAVKVAPVMIAAFLAAVAAAWA